MCGYVVVYCWCDVVVEDFVDVDYYVDGCGYEVDWCGFGCDWVG